MILYEKNQLKIAFIHNMYINYRLPLFERLSRKFDITFFFDEVDPMTTVSAGRFDFKVLRSILIIRPYNRTFSPTLAFHLLKRKPDIFVGSGMNHLGAQIAFLLSRFTRKPFILWEETWHWTRTPLRMLMWPITRALLMRAEAIVVPGLKAKEFVTAAGAKPEKVFVAPNAALISTSENTIHQAEVLKEKLGLLNKKVVLYFGRLIERKGLSVLIEAFARLQADVDDAFLLIVGDGPLRNEAERKCQILAVRKVRFTGFVSEEEKASYFTLADVFVLPAIRSGREVEIWGLVLNEAMCLAKPVISTPGVGGAYDLIRNEVNGFIVKEGDVGALFERLKKLLMDLGTARRMGFEAKKTIDVGFTYDLMADGFVNAIQHAVGGKI
jgi:glycosyltransferase involved in cell wall biosynthesis